MQTAGSTLLTAEPCRLPRMLRFAHDGCSAWVAVRPGWRERGYLEGTVDTNPSLVRQCQSVGYHHLPENLASHVPRSIGERRMSLWSALMVSNQ